ncbi:LuxS/MPP-like metallohydrolase, partial [Haematococcus lacustris]
MRLQSLTLDFFCSSEDVQTVVQLFAEVLMSPAMPDDRLQLYKDQVWGPWRDWERPDAAVLGVVGDFSPLDMVSLLERQLGAWHPAPGQPPTPRKVQQSAEPLAPAAKHAGLLYVVDRPGLAQASVVVAEPGVRLEEPDSYPLEVLSTAFNSFGGQLFDQIRSREGLAYSFVFNFASVSAQLQRTLVYDLLELPSDLLFRYKAGIEAVEAGDVLRAARAHLH